MVTTPKKTTRKPAARKTPAAKKTVNAKAPAEVKADWTDNRGDTVILNRAEREDYKRLLAGEQAEPQNNNPHQLQINSIGQRVDTIETAIFKARHLARTLLGYDGNQRERDGYVGGILECLEKADANLQNVRADHATMAGIKRDQGYENRRTERLGREFDSEMRQAWDRERIQGIKEL